MSSIRLKIIVQLIVMAIQKCSTDPSPYVRKAVAHAISKVYSLDPEHKEELIEVIKTLLSDKSTVVLGSAVAAFMEVCPERYDLIHPNYRKLCHLVQDID
jgi:AP-3 complex subunit beta